MSELPERWSQCELREVGEIITGNTPSKSNSDNYGDEYPWVKPPDLGSDTPITSTAEHLSEQGAKQARLLPAGATLVSCIGILGKVGLAGTTLATNQQINSVVFDQSLVLPEYGFHYCKTLKNWLDENSSSTTLAIVNKGRFSEAPFLLSPLNEQRRIVAKLEKLLSRAGAAQARLATIRRILKQFRQSVLAAACSGRLTADWRQQMAAEAQANPDCILANGEIPSSWQMMSVEKIAKIGSGQTSAAIIEKCTAKGEVGWFKVSDMNSQGNEEFMYVSKNYLKRKDVEELRVKVFPKGSIIFPKRGGAIFTNKKRILIEPSCLDLNLMVLTPEESLRDYFWVWFSTINLGSLSDGSNVPQINNTDILPLEVPLPPLPEQQEIVRRVEALFKTADALEARYRTAKTHVDKLTQSILAKAFRGDLVPQDPNDEPASVLLERIHQERNGEGNKKPRRRK